MKKYSAILLFFITAMSFAQSVNDYKYVLVPSRFAFLNKADLYTLNTLTKGLLEKYGFVAYLDTDAIPDDIRDYNCNKLYVDVLEHNNITYTKLTVVLKDCKNNILFTSEEGRSKEKEWRVGYNEALRGAFKSFDRLGYKYNGSVTQVEREVIKKTNDGTRVTTETVPVHSQELPKADGAMLFAQPIANGFQLVDSTPKVVMKIFSTSSKDMYIAEKGSLKGVLRNDNGIWVFEYYVEGKLVSEKVNIKF